MQGPQGGRIILDGKEVVNMASNNYLGLANDPALVEAAQSAIQKYGVGPGAGRSIAGNFPVHNDLESELAAFKEVEASLVFNSGLTANYGLIPTLVGKGDTVYSDELNHASIIDGIRLSRAEVKVFKHLDMNSLEERLKEPVSGKKLVITDGVFSMDGDLAPLPDMAGLCRRHEARLMVDDAHGDGVMGRGGRGTVDHFGLVGQVDVESGSLSKALGAVGGFVAGSRALVDETQAKARSFIFTSSPLPPAFAAACLASVRILAGSEERVKKLWENREYFMGRLLELGFNTGTTKTPIIPVYAYDEEVAKQLSQRLYEAGVYSQAIAFPIVPRGQARLRVIVSAAHTRDDLDLTVEALAKVGREMKLI